MAVQTLSNIVSAQNLMIMRDQQAISIPETCHQSWGQMAVVNDGRHCEHCCKTVIDFTQMSNAEIITHLVTKSDICGRISQIQIDQLNDSLSDKNKHRFKWKRWVAAASIISLIAFSKSQAKPRFIYSTKQVPIKKENLPGTDTLFKTIKGKIVVVDRNWKSDGPYIHVRGTNINGKADRKGRFKLRVPVCADTLEVMDGPRLGMGQYVKIGSNDSVYHVNFENGFIRMGEIKIKPGQKFNNELLKRSAREAGLLNEPPK